MGELAKKIVVTGGSGMVGKELKKILPDAIYLSSYDYDLRFQHEVSDMLSKYEPTIIIHLAALVGGITDNINRPYDYFTDNILMNSILIDYAKIHEVERFIGVLSTCIYPDVVDSYPMKESYLHKGPPTATNFSYGISKRAMATQIDSCNEQYNTKYQYIIPCNLYGLNDKFDNRSHFVASLLMKIKKAVDNKDSFITLYGTGQPLRQFMNAKDLALVIKQCIDNDVTDSFNLAPEENLTIKEIAQQTLDILGLDLDIRFDSNFTDGQYRKDVDITKFKKLFPSFKFTNLADGIKEVYDKISC